MKGVTVGDPDIWRLLFDQTPPVLRWVLYILSGGVLLLAVAIWKAHRKRIEDIERRESQWATKEDVRQIRRDLGEFRSDVNRHMETVTEQNKMFINHLLGVGSHPGSGGH